MQTYCVTVDHLGNFTEAPLKLTWGHDLQGIPQTVIGPSPRVEDV